MGRRSSYDISHRQIYFIDDVNMPNKMRTSLINDGSAKASPSNFKIKEIFKNEDNKIKKEKKSSAELVSFASLFRFANKIDILCIMIGTFAALAHGAAFPLMLLVFGNLVDVFTDRSFDLCQLNFTLLNSFCPENIHLTNKNFRNEYQKCNFPQENFTPINDNFMTNIRKQSMWLAIMGCAIIVIGYFQVTFWSIACERQTRRLRETLFRSILNKDIAYFDTHKTGQLSTRLTEDVNKVHDGTGDKVGSALQFIGSSIAGIILGFIKGWKLTLVLLSLGPIVVVSAAIFTRITATMTSQELKAYAKAGAIAEEVLSSIRTVFAYNGATYESKRYEKHLRSAKLSGIRKGGLNGMLMGEYHIIAAKCASHWK
ncbi:unnamed protein product [Rotaria sp. Silwood1]|nr:unnamed protein product [Rotaria sp. Silwood1]